MSEIREAGDPLEYWDSIFCICKGAETCMGCLIRHKIVGGLGDGALDYIVEKIDLRRTETAEPPESEG